MAVRPILRLGHPTLREIAAPVPAFDTPELHTLVEDMLDTMRANDGAGLAAIQIGVLQRVVIFGLEYSPRYPTAEPVPLTVLVNPEIEPIGAAISRSVGCPRRRIGLTAMHPLLLAACRHASPL